MASCLNTCFLDSLTVTSFFGSGEMRAIFNDRALMQAWLDVEAALAGAQADLGLVPASAAERIASQADARRFDLEQLAQEIAFAQHPLVPLSLIHI